MKKSLCILVFLLLFVFAAISGPSGVASPSDQTHINIRLEQCITLGSLEDDLLFQWIGVATDSHGNIYVTDSMDYSLKKISSDGNLLKKRGGRGQGPGEFMAPRLLEASENCLYVTDHLIPGIQVFDKDLEFLRHIPLQDQITDFCVLRENEIAVSPLAVNSPSQIRYFDDTGKLLRTLILGQDRADLIMDQFSFVIDESKNVFVAYTFQDRIEKIDAEGTRLWSKELIGIRNVKKENISGYILPTELVYKDVDLDSQGFLYILGGGFSAHPSRDVYVLAPDGSHIATLTLPDTSHCLYIDENDNLYSRANAGVSLVKSKMKYR